MGNFFTLPDNFIATLTSYTSDIFNDFKPAFVLLIGLFLGIFVVRKILELFLHREISLTEEDEEEL